ncbi:MAG: biotin/lipoyl-binding protein [Propionibacteriaceae bacterium]|nr:biotin/lipoyl-binding protein [Propionibacteriaceae bacterium]
MNKRMRHVLVAGASLVAVGAIGTVWATSSSAAQGRYVTAVAATGDVSQSFLATGTISRENLVDAAFSVTGTVKKLKVGVGDIVTAGDVLATLDTAALKLALLNAETDLASAKANLYAAEHPSSSSSGSRGSSNAQLPSGSGSGTSGGGTSGGTSVPSGITASDAAKLYEAIAAVNVATLKWSNPEQPTTCDLILTALLNANEQEPETTDPETDSGGETDPGTDAGSGDAGGSEESGGTENPGDGGETGDSSDTVGEDDASLAPQTTGEGSAEAAASTTGSEEAPESGDDTEQLALVVDDITLDDIKECGQAREDLLLANAVLADYYQQLITTGTIAGDDDSGDGTTTPSAPSGSSSSSSAKSSSSSSSASVSARAVASAEADVLRSQQAVDAAETALANAELVAPIAGTVGAISLSAGAGSSEGTVTIVGEGTALVSIEVPLTTRVLLSQGMTATVTPAGATDSLEGTVSTISILETSGTAGDSPTYTTTIAVVDPDLVLKEGARAGVEIVTATAGQVVTVPASAVTPTGAGTGTVQVVDAASSDTAETVTVSTGAVGGGRVEITEGLTEGQIVVLSDRTIAMDTLTSSQSSRGTVALGGGFPR